MKLDTNSGGGSEGDETLRIGLNGFGRVGRSLLRASLTDNDVDIVAINDVMDDDDMEYLLRYDSVHGRLEGVSRRGDTLFVNDQEFQLRPSASRRRFRGTSLRSTLSSKRPGCSGPARRPPSISKPAPTR